MGAVTKLQPDEEYQGFEQPNYTMVPNKFFDEVLGTLDTMAEVKVLLVIIRKTLGWHKRRDVLSISQLVELTGMSRETVTTGTQKLLERGLIVREAHGSSYSYWLNINPYLKALKKDEEGEGSRNIRLEVVGISDTPLVGISDTQKKDIKENIKENISASASDAGVLSKKPVKREPNPNQKHPAVLAFKAGGDKIYPITGEWADEVANTVKDLDFWKQVVKVWRGVGKNPISAMGMLGWYKNGIPEYHRPTDYRAPATLTFKAPEKPNNSFMEIKKGFTIERQVEWLEESVVFFTEQRSPEVAAKAQEALDYYRKMLESSK